MSDKKPSSKPTPPSNRVVKLSSMKASLKPGKNKSQKPTNRKK